MGDVRNGGRRNGFWEMWGMVGEGMDCGRNKEWWEKKWIVGDVRHAGEARDCGRNERWE